jgi:hypothetical protein
MFTHKGCQLILTHAEVIPKSPTKCMATFLKRDKKQPQKEVYWLEKKPKHM